MRPADFVRNLFEIINPNTSEFDVSKVLNTPEILSKSNILDYFADGEVLMPRSVTIKKFLNLNSVHTIGHDLPLIKAHQMMREFNIRHLPVLDGGKVVGLLSQRDLALVESLKDVNPETLKVEEACSSDPYQVSPTASLKEVSENLAQNKYGCAIVVENHKVIGVFTTEDAIMALTTFIK